MGHKKWNIGWGTVSACNMKCEFCYSKTRRIPDKDLGLTAMYANITLIYVRL